MYFRNPKRKEKNMIKVMMLNLNSTWYKKEN